jgi:alpha-glucosidase
MLGHLMCSERCVPQPAGKGGTSCVSAEGPSGAERILRFVIGTTQVPTLAFAAPEAPGWSAESAAELICDGRSFALVDRGKQVLAGRASLPAYRLAIDVGEAEILGFGAAMGGSNRNGTRFRLMTRDTLLYGIAGASYTAMPFFISRAPGRCIGVLVATAYPLDVEVAQGRVSLAAACAADRTPIDVIVFRGSLADIVRDLGAVVGRSFLPPAWALGFHQSRWSYKTAAAVLEVARRFRALDLPADVVHLDIHYMDEYRVFTFSPRRFPDPQAMHSQLRQLGFRTLAIVDPGVAVAPYPVHEQLQSGDMLLTRGDGTPYVGRVWPGAAVFPDFSRPGVREAWGRLHRPLVEAGVAGFWNDMNDPVFKFGDVYDPLAEDVWHHGVPHRRIRNLYANGMAEATVSGLRSVLPRKRPFVLSRSGFLGIQRHAAVWTGDNHSSWQHLRENLDMVLNLGLSGVPIAGADVGGFGRGPGKLGVVKPLRPSAELYVRWMELGALMPFFRVHCTQFARGQEPWRFGRRALGLARAVLRRRYRFLPLLYRLALEAHTDGLPIVRPLRMHFAVPEGQGAEQFLLGDSLLAAPVLHAGVHCRQLWLPEGEWIDWYTGVRHTGARLHEVDAPLGTTPLFVRAGTALFLAEPRRNAEETLRAPLSLEVTAPAAGTIGHGCLFLDDGESVGGERLLVDVKVEHVGQRLRLRLDRRADDYDPVQRDLELRLPGDAEWVVVDGQPLQLQTRTLAEEGRGAAMAVARVPVAAREVWVA